MTGTDAREERRPAIPISWQQLASAKLLMKPIAGTLPASLKAAAIAVDVETSALDLSLWRTLGGW